MKFEDLASKKNLILAWERLATSTNANYKNFFRHILNVYQLTARDNLSNLRIRLLDGEFEPHSALKIFYPKSNGLQRPLSFLALENQIVYQAFANIFAAKISPEIHKLWGKSVFSNWFNQSNSIFFLQDWKEGYIRLEKKIVETYKRGNKWAVSFDIAAFYDTIDHDLLLNVVLPRGGGPRIRREVKHWLNVWSSKTSRHNHGIPQGPIASTVISEGFLMSIDQTMGRLYKYFRYADDIRILGASEHEVRQAVVHLDVLCKTKGLIPQVSKLGITKLSSLRELRASLPQVWGYSGESVHKARQKKKPEEVVMISIAKGGRKVVDKSSLRFGLFRAKKNHKVLEKVLRLIPYAPEHIDLYMHYLGQYDNSEMIVKHSTKLLRKRIPYEYVAGELWKTLARLAKKSQKRGLVNLAIKTLKNKYIGNGAKIGAYSFLCSCERDGLGKLSLWLKAADSISLSFVTPYLDLDTLGGKALLPLVISRKLPDPILGLTGNILQSKDRLSKIKLNPSKTHPAVLSGFRLLGLAKSTAVIPRNPLGRLLHNKFGTPLWDKWTDLLGKDYLFAYDILLQAESLYFINPSSWLAHLDSFNEISTRKLQDLLMRKGIKGAIGLVDKHGKRLDIGVILNTRTFHTAFPKLVNKLSTIHKRRSNAPSTHPYDKPSGKRTIKVNDRERVRLRKIFSEMVVELINTASSYL